MKPRRPYDEIDPAIVRAAMFVPAQATPGQRVRIQNLAAIYRACGYGDEDALRSATRDVAQGKHIADMTAEEIAAAQGPKLIQGDLFGGANA